MPVYKSKNKTKDGRQYFFRIKYKDVFGETHDYTSPKYFKKKDAEDEEALYRIKVNNKELTITSVTIKDAYLDYYRYKTNSCKKQTLIRLSEYYNKYIKFFENKKINDLTLNDYKSFINNLNNHNFSAAYKNKLQGVLRCIINHSYKYYGTSNYILRFFENFNDVNHLKKEMSFYNYEEFKKFISVIDDLNYKTFFEVLYFLGLRKGEAQALTWKDISFEKKELKINKTLTTKIKGEKWTISTPKTKNSIRTLPIPQNLLNDLKSIYNCAIKYRDFENTWFVFGNTVPFKETTICVKKNKYSKIAKIKQIRIHDFRHSCASLLINKGASIALVSKYLGHSNITITLNTYVHLFKNELQEMTKLLDNL